MKRTLCARGTLSYCKWHSIWLQLGIGMKGAILVLASVVVAYYLRDRHT